MNFYTSDLHFGHRNVIRFDNRPFSDITEMDNCLIENWNKKVNNDDHIYVLGDFAYKSELGEEYYLSKLNGIKHLVSGNHDLKLLKNEKALSYFESVDALKVIVEDHKQITLCHYPIASWLGSMRGSYMLYGHIHISNGEVVKFMRERGNSYNVCTCVNNYEPVTLEELIINNDRFYSQV